METLTFWQMPPAPTIIEQPSTAATEAARAKFWRKSIVKLSRVQLGKMTGYSTQAISLFEQGYDHNGKPLGERAWKRYRLVCAGLMTGPAWLQS